MIGIYIIRNKLTGKIYVGQTTNYHRRVSAHKQRYTRRGSEAYSKLYPAMRKYGIENFEFKFIEECKKEELNKREQYWIKFYDSYRNGYNATLGGNKRISYWQGKQRDDETKRKLSKAITGRKLPEWHTRKISEALKGKPRDNKHRQKKVVCIETGQVFESIKVAAKFIGVHESGIIRVLKGRRQKMSGGYHWKYFSKSQETIPNGSTAEDELPSEVQTAQIGR